MKQTRKNHDRDIDEGNAKRQKLDKLGASVVVEERELEEFLFGFSKAPIKSDQSINKPSVGGEVIEDDHDEDLEAISFAIDTAPDATTALVASNEKQSEAAWHDEDDEQIVVNLTGTNRLKKLTYSNKNVDNKSVVTGKEFSELLRHQFDSSQAKNVWADSTLLSQRKNREQKDFFLSQEESQLLQEADSMIENTKKSAKWTPLSEGKLPLQRLQDITYEESCTSRVSSVQFHRDNEHVLVASDDHYLRLFRMDEENSTNHKVLGIEFKDLNIKNAKFIGKAHQELVVCGRRPYYYSYNLETGQVAQIPKSTGMTTTTLEHVSISPEGTRMGFIGAHGYIHIVDSSTKQWAIDMKMNTSLRSMSFLSEYQCVSSGFDAEIYFWDLRYPNGKCISKFRHEDGTATSYLSTYTPPSSSSYPFYSLNTAFISLGSLSGVNAIYEGYYQSASGLYNFAANGMDDEYVSPLSVPKPLKSVMNLTTKITTSAFHPSGQILAIGSNEKKDQLRFVHLPSGTVFRNWPQSTTPLHTVETMDFSPNGKYFAVGNKRGKVLLYRLNRFV